jgi:hypothetical protein
LTVHRNFVKWVQCHVYEKTPCQNLDKFITEEYLQIYKTLQLFTSLSTKDRNTKYLKSYSKCQAVRDWLVALLMSFGTKWNNVTPIYINLHTVHVQTSRVEKLDSGIVLLIEVCPQTYQINYWLFTGLSSSWYNAICTKRLLVTIKTKSLQNNIYKYTITLQLFTSLSTKDRNKKYRKSFEYAKLWEVGWLHCSCHLGLN